MEEKWLNVSDENGVKNQMSITSCRLYSMWLIIALYEWTHVIDAESEHFGPYF